MNFSELEMDFIWRGLNARKAELERASQELFHLSDGSSHKVSLRFSTEIEMITKLMERVRTEHYAKIRLKDLKDI